MEIYCEDRFVNFPPDVEFQLNGKDAGEYEEPVRQSTKVQLLESSGMEWDKLSREIDHTVREKSLECNNNLPDLLPCRREISKPQPIHPFLSMPLNDPPPAVVASPPDSGYSSSASGKFLFFPELPESPTQQQHFEGGGELFSESLNTSPMRYQRWGDGYSYEAGDQTPLMEYQYRGNESLCYTTPGELYNFTDFKPYSRGKKGKEQKYYCVFCKNNNEPPEIYMSHSVKDGKGNVTCPRLFRYVCPRCNVSGNKAHTIKYCPLKPIITLEMTEMMSHKGQHHRAGHQLRDVFGGT